MSTGTRTGRKPLEVTGTPPRLIADLRRLLHGFMERLAEWSEEGLGESPLPPASRCRFERWSGDPRLRIVGAVDGGSHLFAVESGHFGLVASTSVVVGEGGVVDRPVHRAEIVPASPEEAAALGERVLAYYVVDKVREALVYEVAAELCTKGVDMVIVDGPLVPRLWLPALPQEERTVAEELARRALERYAESLVTLIRRAEERGVTLAGFVKRPRSRFLGHERFDHLVLSRALGPGEYAPAPPAPVPAPSEASAWEALGERVTALGLRYTFLRTVESRPPFRLDLGPTFVPYESVLSYVMATRTGDGVPFVIAKVDEEARLGERFMRELFDDCLVSLIFRRGGLRGVIFVLPQWGE